MVIVNHSINMDAVAHVHRQNHGEKPSTEKCSCLHSVWGGEKDGEKS